MVVVDFLFNHPPTPILPPLPGDNIHTAQHIARDCGILTEGGLAMEGPDFRKLSDKELLPLLPRLQVLNFVFFFTFYLFCFCVLYQDSVDGDPRTSASSAARSCCPCCHASRYEVRTAIKFMNFACFFLKRL